MLTNWIKTSWLQLYNSQKLFVFAADTPDQTLKKASLYTKKSELEELFVFSNGTQTHRKAWLNTVVEVKGRPQLHLVAAGNSMPSNSTELQYRYQRTNYVCACQRRITPDSQNETCTQIVTSNCWCLISQQVLRCYTATSNLLVQCGSIDQTVAVSEGENCV